MSVYDILADFAYASALILVGQFLRSKVTFFQKFFIPASMLAGFLGLLLGSQFMNVIHFSDAMGSYAGLLVIPVFAIIGLNGFIGGHGTGLLVSQLVLGETPCVDVPGLRYDRFKAKA